MSICKSLKNNIPEEFQPFLKKLWSCLRGVYSCIIRYSLFNYFKIRRLKRLKDLKINIGSGKAKLQGWLNIDIEPGADLVLDIRKRLPFSDESVTFIYSEHILEHLTYEEGRRFLLECYRCLRKGKILRIAMPDLDEIVQKYETNWRNQDWLSWPGFQWIKTKGQMLNIAFRWWGHKYLYNEEDLRNQLDEIGFGIITRCEWNKSSRSELCNLETRKDSKLIVEAIKT